MRENLNIVDLNIAEEDMVNIEKEFEEVGQGLVGLHYEPPKLKNSYVHNSDFKIWVHDAHMP